MHAARQVRGESTAVEMVEVVPITGSQDQPTSLDPEDDALQTQSSVEEHRPRNVTLSAASRQRRESDDQDLVTTLARSNAAQADALLQLSQGLLESRQGNRQLRCFTDYIYESIDALPRDLQSHCYREIYQVLEKYQQEAGGCHQNYPATA